MADRHLIDCHACGTAISREARACPACGQPRHFLVAEATPGALFQTLRVIFWSWILLVPLAALIVLARIDTGHVSALVSAFTLWMAGAVVAYLSARMARE